MGFWWPNRLDPWPGLHDKDSMPGSCSVIIPHLSERQLLYECLSSLRPPGRALCEVIVVDNSHGESTGHALLGSQIPTRLVVVGKNIGYAAAVNCGARIARGDLLFVLNDDARVVDTAMARLLEAAEAFDSAGAFACRVADMAAPWELQSAGLMFHSALYGNRRSAARAGGALAVSEVFAPCGAAAAYRRSLFLENGGFDESFFAYGEDLELGVRLVGNGHQTLYLPSVGVLHRLGATADKLGGLRTTLMTRNSYRVVLQTIPLTTVMRHLFTAARFHTALAWRLLRGPGRWDYLRAVVWLLMHLPWLVLSRCRQKRMPARASDRIERLLSSGELVLRLPGELWKYG